MQHDSPPAPGAGRRERPVAFRPADALGFITPAELERLAATMRAMKLPSAKMTADGRFLLLGLDPEAAPAARVALGQQARPRPCSVHACPGAAGCPNGLRDTFAVARRLEALLTGLALPAKVKAGISGCPRCCAESMVRDIGLIGRRNGWSVVFGGSAGIAPRTGGVLADGLADDEALDLIARVLQTYSENSRTNERTARFAQRLGDDAVRSACGLS